MGWADRFTSLDVETTGVDPIADRIVEIAAVRVTDGKVCGRYSSLINPGRPIPSEVSAVHGITDAMVADAPTFGGVAIDLVAFIGDDPIAGFNSEFDRRFVAAEWDRAGLVPSEWVQSRWLCALVWIREAQKYEKGKKLGQVAARLGIEQPDGAHRALADAITCAHVLLALRRPSAWADWSRRTGQHPRDFFPAEIEECIRAQEALRARQEEDFKAWRDRQPKRETGT